MLRRVRNDFAADHLVDHAVVVGVGDLFRGHVPAIAQDGDFVAEAEDFLHAMGDVDDRDAALFQVGQQVEEVLALGERKGTRGFVHHDHPRMRAHRGGDLDDLLLPRAKSVDGQIHIDGSLDFRQHGAGCLAHPHAVDPAEPVWHIAEAEIFRDGQIGAKREFLLHHRDAQMPGDQGIGGMDQTAVEVDFPGIRGVDTGQDFAERAFARAVFTHEACGSCPARFQIPRHPGRARRGSVW